MESLRHSATQALFGDRAPLMEALATVDAGALSLALDEIGWQRLGGAPADNGNDLVDWDRVEIVKRARLYWHRDPFAKQAVRLYTAYCLGQGVTVRHTQADAQGFLDRFRRDPLNAKVIGPLGLRRLSNKLLVDGEVFVAVIAANPQRPQVRLLDCLLIGEIITNPDDAENVWYYRYDPPEQGGKARYYRAADAEWGDEGEEAARQRLGAKRAAAIAAGLQDKVQVIHVAINSLGQRGYSLLCASLDWAKQLRKTMEDRATIVHAAAQFAYKKTVKGGASAVNALAAAQRTGGPASGAAVSSGQDRRGPVAGATYARNDAVDLEQFKFDTQATNAAEDVRTFKLHFETGVGLPEHMFADGKNGTRATSTTMERPVELTLGEYQEVVVYLLEALYGEVLEAGQYARTGLTVLTPPILRVDLPQYLTAIADLVEKLPAFNKPFLWKEILAAIGVKDVDAALRALQGLPELEAGPPAELTTQPFSLFQPAGAPPGLIPALSAGLAADAALRGAP